MGRERERERERGGERGKRNENEMKQKVLLEIFSYSLSALAGYFVVRRDIAITVTPFAGHHGAENAKADLCARERRAGFFIPFYIGRL